eukprot:CAMPEP_0170496642 /NCGR_PEP_ID=MMETSP0208-20121228/22283_1 /TAXON_ID=197538 /ORGANISM="Strombidium inclinatum, Strain S3" /LENGTH=98 /DNA_ID=CAMNT_0010773243 /DNA_START=88 /DNA_END=384 /DNA_ORIENTATION=+
MASLPALILLLRFFFRVALRQEIEVAVSKRVLQALVDLFQDSTDLLDMVFFDFLTLITPRIIISLARYSTILFVQILEVLGVVVPEEAVVEPPQVGQS